MKSELFQRLKAVPPIVHIVISQATRHRAQGAISEPVFAEQLRRIAREELEPKGLSLLVRDLPDGRTRFIVKEKATGAVCDILEFAADGWSQPDPNDEFARPSRDDSKVSVC